MEPIKVQWGVEFQGPTWQVPALEKIVNAPLAITPVFGADFKTFEELRWIVNMNVVGGVEFLRAGALRRLRFLVNYYHGYNPYGQFYGQKVESVGLGIYVAF